jgi:putative MATE family efflux protein
MFKQTRGKTITSGNLFLGILQFAIPLYISALVQNLFTAADTAIAGNFADGMAVAAIGAGNPVINLLIGCFVSFATGAGMIVARAIGSKDTVRIKESVDTAMVFALALGVFLTVAALILSKPVLEMMDCPEDCFGGAVLYMNIYMLGTPALMVYNFASAIIRAEGDSTRPLIYIMISGGVNVVTNLLLCLVLANKVAAVAIATVVSQTISAVLAVTRLVTKKDGLCRFSFRELVFRGRVLAEVFRYGFPLSVAAAIYPIANLQIQPAINSYGAANLAGVTSANTIDTVTNALQTSFNSTCVTFMSQNIGAHNRKRVEKTIVLCGLCAIVSGLVIGLLTAHVFSEELLGIFLPDFPEAIYYGQKKMQYTTAFYWLAAIVGWLGSAVQAFGYPALSTMNNLVSVLGFRIIWMNFIYCKAPSVDLLYVCYTISWALTGLINVGLFIYAYRKYRQKERLYQIEHQ